MNIVHRLLIYSEPQFLQGGLLCQKKGLWKNYHFVSIRHKHELSHFNCLGVLVIKYLLDHPVSRCARMAEHKSRPKTTKSVISGHDCCAN